MSVMNVPEVLQRIELTLISKGMSKEEFYKASGITSASYSNWNTGKHRPTVKMLMRAADALDVSLQYLITGTDAGELEATIKAPVQTDERIKAMQERVAMLVDLFERLPPDDQNDVLYQLIAKAHDQLDREKRKESE